MNEKQLILVIEDEKSLSSALQKRLEKEKFEVALAEDGNVPDPVC